jgi:hypothetical protein
METPVVETLVHRRRTVLSNHRHPGVGPGYSHVSSRTTTLALELLRRVFALCPRRDTKGHVAVPKNALSDPDRVVARLDSFVSAYGTRAMLYETWVSNPSLFDLLLLLFDRS